MKPAQTNANHTVALFGRIGIALALAIVIVASMLGSSVSQAAPNIASDAAFAAARGQLAPAFGAIAPSGPFFPEILINVACDPKTGFANVNLNNVGSAMSSPGSYTISRPVGGNSAGSFQLGQGAQLGLGSVPGGTQIVVSYPAGEGTSSVASTVGCPPPPEIQATTAVPAIPTTAVPGIVTRIPRPIITNTPTPPCGVITRPQSSTFPVVSTDPCQQDTTVLKRAVWTPIKVGAAVCLDFILFHSNRDGLNSWNVYRIENTSGKPATLVNLTKGGARTDNVAPALSPDRATIAFTSDRDGNWEVYVVGADGKSRPQRVTYNTFAADLDPVWSPDGTSIVYTSARRGNFDLFKTDVTKGPESEVQITNGPANELNPFFAPDGKTLVYESQSNGASEIFSLDLATLKSTKISDGSSSDYSPVFSPDGKFLLWRGYRSDNVGVIYLANADGSNKKIISNTTVTAYNHSVSPDDKLVAWQSAVDGVMTVFIYEIESGKTRQLTDRTGSNGKDAASYAPGWTCNTGALVFSSDVNGAANIFSTTSFDIAAPPVKVDKDTTAITKGTGKEQNLYSENAPGEEDASSLGLVPYSGKR